MQNPQVSGVVLEDFDTGFTNQFYQSYLDDLRKFFMLFSFLSLFVVDHNYL